MAGAGGAVSDGRTRRLREHEFVFIVQPPDAVTSFALLTLDPVELAADAAEPVVTAIQPVFATGLVEPVVPVSIRVDTPIPGQLTIGLLVHAGQ